MQITRRANSVMLAAMFGVVLTIALALSAAQARAQDSQETKKCSDYKEGTPCTFMEEYGYCLTTAIESYEECKTQGGFLWDVGCTIAYEADYYACAAIGPMKYLVNQIK